MKISRDGILLIICLFILAIVCTYTLTDEVAEKAKTKAENYEKQLNAISRAIKDADIDGVTVGYEEIFVLTVKKGDDPESLSSYARYIISPGGYAEKHIGGAEELLYWGSPDKK